MKRSPLPDELQGRPFTVGEARTVDVPARRLRATDLARPYSGLRAPQPAEVWAQLGSTLSLDELNVAADHLLHGRLADIDELRAAIERLRRRGAVRVAVEYDGRQHAERGQFARDADRWADIEASGWTLIRVLAHHLAVPASVISRTRRALLARGLDAVPLSVQDAPCPRAPTRRVLDTQPAERLSSGRCRRAGP